MLALVILGPHIYRVQGQASTRSVDRGRKHLSGKLVVQETSYLSAYLSLFWRVKSFYTTEQQQPPVICTKYQNSSTMRTSTFLLSGIAALANAYTKPQDTPTWGALLLPNVDTPVTRGKPFDITWDPKYGDPNRPIIDGQTVSLVLCRGDSKSCNPDATAIVEGVPVRGTNGDFKWTWNVPCDLRAGVKDTATGTGMLIIVDQTGEFQYSTQFSVEQGDTCP